jgi:tetratricopeptide (TPR) repeat protein
MWTGVLVAAFLFQAASPANQDWQSEGLKALDARNYPAAIAAFEKGVSAEPGNYAAHFHLALAYSLAGKDPEAIAEYRKTLEQKPDLYEANLNVGILLLRGKQADAAVEPLRRATAAKPNEAKAAVYLGDALLDSGKLEEARSVYSAALSRDPKAAAAELGLARAELRAGNLDAAAQRFAKAAELEPAYAEASLELAEAYESQKRLAEATAIYAKFPQNAGAQERAGEILLSTGKAAEAVKPLEFAVGQSPTSANRLALATAYFAAKDVEKGAKILNEALAGDPNNYSLRMLAGRVLRDHKRYTEAATQFLAAASIKPESVEPWGEIVTVSMVGDNYPQALAGLDKIKALGGENTSHFYLRAIILDKQNVLKPALEYYQRFLAASNGKFPDEEFKARQRARIIQKELSKR